MTPSNADELKRRIENAFADTVYPGDAHIATNPDHCDECSDTDDFFRWRHWQELSGLNQKLQTGWGGLSFLSPPAWRYFLPAYLLVGLGGGEPAEYFQERASGFTPVQQKCLAAYAAAFSEMEPEDDTYQAAAAYWKEKAASIS